MTQFQISYAKGGELNLLPHFVLKSLGNYEESNLKDEESRTEGDKTENVLTATLPTDDLTTSDGGIGHD